MQITNSFSDKGVSAGLFVRPGDSFNYVVDLSSDFDGHLFLERTDNGGLTYVDQVEITADVASQDVHDAKGGDYRFRVEYAAGEVALTGTADITLSEGTASGKSGFREILNGLGQVVGRIKEKSIELLYPLETTAQAEDSAIGTVNQPASGSVACRFERLGSLFRLTFTLTAARVPVTDGAGSGSFGALKLFDFAEQGLVILGCRQNYTAYAPDGTGVPDDTAFVIGLGTDAITAAADGALAAAEKNIGASIAQTLSSGTTTGTAHTASNLAADGTGTAKDINLNVSGSAATVDGDGTLDVTGTITIVGLLLGDD